MIRVTETTLQKMKAYKKEFDFKSMDEAIEDAIQWARAFVYIEATQRREIQKRLIELENQVECNTDLIKDLASFVELKKND